MIFTLSRHTAVGSKSGHGDVVLRDLDGNVLSNPVRRQIASITFDGI